MSLPAETWRQEFPCATTALRLPGPAGMLEALAACPAEEQQRNVVGIVCHPHPLYGGTLNNKVVHTVARAFTDLGARALRFNFRGVGNSDGEYDHGNGETDDLLAVLDWVRLRRPDDEIWLAGFSFGAYVALRAAAQVPVQRLITIAPAVHLYDFAALPTPNCPWILVQGGADEVVPASDVLAWRERLTPAPQLIYLESAGHFFHQRLNDLRGELTAALGGRS